MNIIGKTKKIQLIFAAIFFFSLHLSLTAYVNSSLIESWGVSNEMMSMIYTLSSIITIFGLWYLPRLGNNHSNRKLVIGLLGLVIIALLGVISLKTLWILLPLMTLFLSLRSLIVLEHDIFLEHIADEKVMGRIRGLLIVLASLAWGSGPFISGYLVDTLSITSVYWIGLVCALVPMIIFLTSFRKETFQKHTPHSLRQMYTSLKSNQNLFYIFLISLGLNTFYALAVIYIPLHLSNVVGFSWTQIGILIFISQIPFMILGYPLGIIADKYIGEKEIMITGIIIGIISLVGMIYAKEPVLISWAIILFISRVGMSFLETGSETYFFKKINHDDAEKIAVQRNTFPLSYLLVSGVGIIIGVFTESFIPFFIIGIIAFIATLYPAFKIEDTL